MKLFDLVGSIQEVGPEGLGGVAITAVGAATTVAFVAKGLQAGILWIAPA